MIVQGLGLCSRKFPSFRPSDRLLFPNPVLGHPWPMAGTVSGLATNFDCNPLYLDNLQKPPTSSFRLSVGPMALNSLNATHESFIFG